jgi:hypothetical protein
MNKIYKNRYSIIKNKGLAGTIEGYNRLITDSDIIDISNSLKIPIERVLEVCRRMKLYNDTLISSEER